MNFRIQPSRFFRGGFFVLLLLTWQLSPLSGQFKFREVPGRETPERLDTNTWSQVWNWFLRNRALGSFVIEGELIHRPASGSSWSRDFRIEGDWHEGLETTRVTLAEAEGSEQSRLVIREADTWYQEKPTTGERVSMDAGDWNQPVFGELPVTWTDLLMPYLAWTPVEYLGPDRFLGRPVHQFGLVNPDEGTFPSRVVITLDEDYAALLKAALFDASGFRSRQMRVTGFRKFGDQWMAEGFVWEDRRARSSVRLNVYSFTTASISGEAP